MVSHKKLKANRANGALGGEATKMRFKQKYKNNPKICPQCGCCILYGYHQNKFCSQS